MQFQRKRKYTEFSLGFSSGNQGLFGKILLPESDKPLPAVIVCHGFGTDHRTMYPIAESIAQQGIIAFLFDFRGHGWSGGICDGNAAADVASAFDYLSSFIEIDKQRISIVGHSMGAAATLMAASVLEGVHSLVLISCPSDSIDYSEEELATFYKHLTQNSGRLMEYPKDGTPLWVRFFPGLSWMWMKLRGYRVVVDWRKMLEANQAGVLSAALKRMKPCQLLFVHCQGDKYIAPEEVMKLYKCAQEPKEIILEPGGFHSAPLLPGKLRRNWIDWLTSAIKLK